MISVQNFVGIDISKEKFDVNYVNAKGKEISRSYEYTIKGIELFIKSIGSNYHCVMEATGVYHTSLAQSLYENNILVTVTNPLTIKHYSRMMMIRTKTDEKDAKMIRNYATSMSQELTVWKPAPVFYQQAQQILIYIEMSEMHLQMYKNQLESILNRAIRNTKLIKQLESDIKALECKIESMNEEVEEILKANAGEELKLIRSIPGIGKKGSAILLIETQGMQGFKNGKQLSSYFGLCPRIYSSGTSVKSKEHICKIGKASVRKQMYLSSLSASRYNRACKEMYDRLIEKGKPKKVALIAIANKLLKIAFAVVKNKKMYDVEYKNKFIDKNKTS